MQAELTGFVDRAEWRWVTFVSVTIILFTFAPLILIATQIPNQSDMQFMGALHEYLDSATYLARMQQGMDGNILTYFRHTPETHAASLTHPLYALLGLLAQLTNQTPFVIYHVIRIFASLFMFLTIYNLGANIWTRVRARRIFFVIASIGAGFGWIVILTSQLHGNINVPDMYLPQIYPLHSSASNVHYPLAIASLALLASYLIPALRPGNERLSSVEDGGAVVFLSSIVLAFIYPDAVLPIALAYSLNIAIHWISKRKINMHEWNWGLWLIVPALPVVTYNLLIYMNNDAVQAWVDQRGTPVPSLLMLLIGLGLPLLIAIPGIWRAARRFEADGDRFMLLWLISMVVTMYLPLRLNQTLLVGLMLPIAYFATRSAEDFWLTFIKRRYRTGVFIAIVPLFLITPILWLYLPTVPTVFGWKLANPTSIERDYAVAFNWINQEIAADSVILAAPVPSTWLPAWSDARVVYGHPAETINSAEKRQAITEWYQSDDPEACAILIETYEVDYVLRGIRERVLGDGRCVEAYTLIATFGEVEIYATRDMEALR